MTSELRPAVAVWEADRELTIAALHAWAEHIGAGYSCPAAAQTMLMAATILEADREAVRAEQAAELAKWRDKYNELGQMALEQVSDLGTKLGRLDVELDAAKADLQAANRELAKFKALAETLAGALDQMHRAVCHETGFAEAVRADSGLAYPWEPLDVAADASLKALREYKEARDAS